MTHTNETESRIRTFSFTPAGRKTYPCEVIVSCWDNNNDGEFVTNLEVYGLDDEGFKKTRQAAVHLNNAQNAELVKQIVAGMSADDLTDLAAEIAGIELPAKETE